MIELRDISKQYTGLKNTGASGIALWVKNFVRLTSNKAAPTLALGGVSFSVARGETFGIYGANGAGKTTLIKILSGLLLPTGGAVEIDGCSDMKCIKNAVSYISTNGWMGLEWQLTARENLLLYGSIFGVFGKRLERRCDEVLRTVGMVDAKDKYISQLSAGMRQKITIARGLILDRPVIFYDEPSVSLDIQSARALRELIQADAARSGRTAIIASHNAGDLAVCGRIMMLSKGKVIALGTPEELAAPLSGIRVIEIKCAQQEPHIDFKLAPGVMSVTAGGTHGKRELQNVKLGVRKSAFSYDRLVDFLIERNVEAHSINEIEISLQEVYEYYLARRGGEMNAVS